MPGRYYAEFFLYNLRVPNGFRLNGNYEIRRSSSKTIEEIRKFAAGRGLRQFLSIPMGDYSLVGKVLRHHELETTQDHQVANALYARAQMEQAIGLLRLYKQGVLGFYMSARAKGGETISEGAEPAEIAYEVFCVFPTFGLSGGVFEVAKDEIGPLTQFFSKHVETLDERGLDFTVEMFNRAYAEPFHHTKLVYLVTILENLFLRDSEERMGLAYKLRMRCASVMGQGLDDRRQIRSSLGKIYGWRSAIVHGNKQSVPSEQELRARLPQLEDLCRRSIVHFLEYPEHLNPGWQDETLLK